MYNGQRSALQTIHEDVLFVTGEAEELSYKSKAILTILVATVVSVCMYTMHVTYSHVSSSG